MKDLITFLRNRLDFDEQDSERAHYSLCSSVALRPGGPCDCGFPEQRQADVAAKRRILDAWEKCDGIAQEPHGGDLVAATRYGLEIALRALAEAYDDYYGYREAWRP